MTNPDIELLKDIPGFQAIVRALLRSQMQHLAQQLSDHGDVETIILTASIPDGSLSHIASHRGQGFLDKRGDIMSQFLSHCLTSKFTEGRPNEKGQLERPNRKVSPKQIHGETHSTVKKEHSPMNHQEEIPHHQQHHQHPQYNHYHTNLNQNSTKINSSTPASKCRRQIITLSSESFKHTSKTHEAEKPSTSYEGQMKKSQSEEINIKIETDKSGRNYCGVPLADGDMETDNPVVKLESLETSIDLTMEGSDIDAHNASHDSAMDNSFNEVIIRNSEDIKSERFSGGTEIADGDTVKNEVVLENVEYMNRKKFSDSNNTQGYEHGQNEVVIEFVNDEKAGFDNMGMGTYMNNSSASVTEEDSFTTHNKTAMEQCPTCSFCGTKFASTSAYKRHIRKHTGENPYHCEECGKKFYRKDDLNTHMLKHYGQKPYHCVLCGMGFLKKVNVQLHMSKIHQTQSYGFTSNLPRAQRMSVGQVSSPSKYCKT